MIKVRHDKSAFLIWFTSVLIGVVAPGCATTDSVDSLDYKAKLLSHGHLSLYRNSAIRVPRISIAFIPQISVTEPRGVTEKTFQAGTHAFAERFVKGYIALPKELKEDLETGENLEEAELVQILSETDEIRKDRSDKTVNLMTDRVRNHASHASSISGQPGKEQKGSYHTTGLSLSVLKSLRWVLGGILSDATIQPATGMTAVSLGYLGVNFFAFPSMIEIKEGVATAKLAVEVSWNASKMRHELVAPTEETAVAGVFCLVNAGCSTEIGAAGVATDGSPAGSSGNRPGHAAAVLVKGGGHTAGKTVQYLGVPLGSAGIALGGGTIGTAMRTAGFTGGGVLYVSGDGARMTTNTVGTVFTGAAPAAATKVSPGGGTTDLSKAVLVPAGDKLGGGIVLNYTAPGHLPADSPGSGSDSGYMVLALDGPRWVLYALRGKPGSRGELPPGAVVDLKRMQEAGEVIYYLPVSYREMSQLIVSLYNNLPAETGEHGIEKR